MRINIYMTVYDKTIKIKCNEVCVFNKQLETANSLHSPNFMHNNGTQYSNSSTKLKRICLAVSFWLFVQIDQQATIATNAPSTSLFIDYQRWALLNY